jgi:Ca-activated chloride channel family protein
MVLLTDGEDLEAGGVAKAKALAEQGVVVFTLGVGTPSGSTIQYVDERGAMTMVRDSKGEPVRSRLDEKTLREIATATRGGYESLGLLGEGMVRVRQAVESSASLTNLVPARKLGVDRFHWFLAPHCCSWWRSRSWAPGEECPPKKVLLYEVASASQ